MKKVCIKYLIFLSLVLVVTNTLLGKTEEAKRLYFGIGQQRDYQAAHALFNASYKENKDPESAKFLGLMYLVGKGVEKNTARAIEFFRISAGMGDGKSKKILEKLDNAKFEVRNKSQIINQTGSVESSKPSPDEISSSKTKRPIHQTISKPDEKTSVKSVNDSNTASEEPPQSIDLRPDIKERSAFETGILYQGSEEHSLWDLTCSYGATKVKEGFGFKLNAGIGLLDLELEGVDPFFKLNLGAGIHYARSLAERGFMNRFIPHGEILLDWDYFDNERTNEYTVGYDYSPLEYSDYYWRYYYSETSGDTFSFTNYSVKGGMSFEIVRNFLYANYTLCLNDSFDDLPSSNSNQFSLICGSPFKGEKDYFYIFSYTDSTLYFKEPLWAFKVGKYL
jgi:hypothetical protein